MNVQMAVFIFSGLVVVFLAIVGRLLWEKNDLYYEVLRLKSELSSVESMYSMAISRELQHGNARINHFNSMTSEPPMISSSTRASVIQPGEYLTTYPGRFSVPEDVYEKLFDKYIQRVEIKDDEFWTKE